MAKHTLIAGLVLALAAATANAGGKNLDIYFLDMVGGGSTLIVTPLGESVLIDTGSLRPAHRDVDRMMRACRDAKLSRIDHLITTHFDSDHYGGILELSKRIDIKTYWDKGAPPPKAQQQSRSFKELYPLYQQATAGNAKALQVGEGLPLKRDRADKMPPLRLHCVTSEKKIEGFDGNIDAPVEGVTIKKPDHSDNARSIALVLTYGDFKFFAGGDITWNVEHHLAHPVNRIGKVDLYQITHHGLDQSNNTVLLEALNPTVAVAMNGPRKGIQPRTFADLAALPGLEAIYQIHYNTQYGDAGNTQPQFIANPKDSPNQGEFIKASVAPNAKTFTLQIGPDGTRQTYRVTR